MRLIDKLRIAAMLLIAALGVAAIVLIIARHAHAASSEHIVPATPGAGPSAAYCAARVHLARLLLEGMRDGTPIENINVAFEQPAPTPELERRREDWVQGLKAEIVFERAGGGGEDAIAQRISARCNGQET